MTESEWLYSQDVVKMLHTAGNTLSQRKLYLFISACVLQEPYLLHEELYSKLVFTCKNTSVDSVLELLCFIKQNKENKETYAPGATQADLLRDIVGNPFRPVRCRQTGNLLNTDTVNIRTDNSLSGCDCSRFTPKIISLADKVYTSYKSINGYLNTHILTEIADALQQEGYTQNSGKTAEQVISARGSVKGCCDKNADNKACDCLDKAVPSDLIAHLRSPGPHVMGCWAIDTILARN